MATYNYLLDRKVNYEDNGNGVRTSYSYDGRGFISGTNTSKPSPSPAKIYSNRTYYRDTRDRIYAWKKGAVTTNNPMENGRGDRYTYDPEGQLLTASYQATTPEGTPGTPQRTDSFAYDQLGNRQSPPNNTIASLGTVIFHRRDNGLNQYLDWTQSAINYESNANLYQDGWLTGSFNARNQPRSIWSARDNPAGAAIAFAYDPLGRCVKRTNLSGISTYLYYDGWNLIQEGPNYTTADRIYAHGNRVDEIVASQYGGVWAYHHYDARGNCIMLTNASGNILEQYDYDAFGKPYFYSSSNNFTAPVTSSGWGNRFLFTGREWLKDIAIYDFRNRHYMPELGRFMQPDPKQFEAGDYNLYRYCHNDPVNKSDPTGLAEHNVQVVAWIRKAWAWLWRGDNHGPTLAPTGEYRGMGKITFDDEDRSVRPIVEGGTRQSSLAGILKRTAEPNPEGSAKIIGPKTVDVSLADRIKNPTAPSPPIAYSLRAQINFQNGRINGSLDATRFPSYQVFVDGTPVFSRVDNGNPAGLFFSQTDIIQK